MADDDKITLRLDRSRTARAFEDTESLWKPEIRRIAFLLGVHLEAVKEAQDSKQPPPELAIAIFGTYGAGKTSLLKTLERQANDEGLGYERGAQTHHVKSRVHALPLIKPSIDPTGNHHFLYAFLATALEKDRQREPGDEVKSPRQFSARLLTEVQQAFQEVSEYLQVLDKPEESKEYDPLGASLDRLERHTSDIHLHDKLQTFIDKLADTLATSRGVVLMPVDDADMSKESLTSTLESYRRYLIHPRLVPVFTFTGRMAEELTCSEFQQRLTVKDRDPEGGRRRKEAALRNESLTVPEQLALQYLAKLFPVRTRIRLGPAPGRVQTACYQRHEEGTGKKSDGSATSAAGTKPAEHKEKVIDLLEHSSRLLFGCPDWPTFPKVQLALRPFSLRRQFQVLDSLYAAGAGDLPQVWSSMPGLADDEGDQQIARIWTKTFDRATWALLNTHRDVLREVNLFLDDLYGLSPKRLREEVLGRILDLHIDTRRKILSRWFYRTEDRRSQILSLLAANVFRPQVIYRKEDEWGDDPDRVRKWHDRNSAKSPKEEENQEQEEEKQRFMAAKSLQWILNLAIGFYLPQVLARNRHHDSHLGKSNPESFHSRIAPLRGTGWNLIGGPVQAIREFLTEGQMHAHGMMRLDPFSFKKKLEGDNARAKLFLDVWCYYGYLDDRPWAAVSLWRGLGLLGRLLGIAERYAELASVETIEGIAEAEQKYSEAGEADRQAKKLDKEAAEAADKKAGDLKSRADGERGRAAAAQKSADDLMTDARGRINKDALESIERMLAKHQQRSLVQADGRHPRTQRESKGHVRFQREPVGEQPDSRFIVNLVRWLYQMREASFHLPAKVETSPDQNMSGSAEPAHKEESTRQSESGSSEMARASEEFKRCFIRRVHGDDFLGELWSNLETKKYEIIPEPAEGGGEPPAPENMYQILKIWAKVFQEYLPEKSLVRGVMVSCPFIQPLLAGKTKVDRPDATKNKGELMSDLDSLLGSSLFRDIHQALRNIKGLELQHDNRDSSSGSGTTKSSETNRDPSAENLAAENGARQENGPSAGS